MAMTEKIQDNTMEGHSSGKEHHINWKKAALIGFIPLLVMLTSFFGVTRLIGEDTYNDVVYLVEEKFGILGIFLYVYIVDTLILPLSPDFVFPIAVGMNPFVMIPIIGGASALGGMTSYSIGRLLYKIPAIKKLTGKAYMKWGGYIQHYGVLFVMLAGIRPLPFSTICVAAGAVQMDARKVTLACLTRFIRAAIYFALFSLML